jgi:hypothetical protein
MSSEMVRWGRLAGLATGAMFVLSGVLTFIVAPPQGALGSFGAYLLEVVIVAAFALTPVAIAGLHAAQSRSGRYRLLGAAGSLLTFVGYAIVLVIAHLISLAGGEPILSVRPVGGLLVLVGSILLGAMTIYARVLPWWCDVLLIFGFPRARSWRTSVRGSRTSCARSFGGR